MKKELEKRRQVYRSRTVTDQVNLLLLGAMCGMACFCQWHQNESNSNDIESSQILIRKRCKTLMKTKPRISKQKKKTLYRCQVIVKEMHQN